MMPEPQTADEWRAQHQEQEVQRLRLAARGLFDESRRLVDDGSAFAEPIARRMLAAAASTFWNAEDTELESSMHDEMDEYGAWVCQTFGCELVYEDEIYFQRCPIAIAHKRIGLSIEHTTRGSTCSICGEDFPDCPHSSSDLYEVKGGVGISGHCPVCISDDCAVHEASQIYRVAPMEIMGEIVLSPGVAFVAKPAFADARLTSIPLDNIVLRNTLGSIFKPGKIINCDRCLSPCSGIEEMSLKNP